MLAGVLLMAAFVWHSFRPEHPLLDLRLFRDRNLTVSIITMFLFAAAFFGGLLLVPTYFQQIRGESTLQAGLLVAPQGLGAMVTMPIAGRLVDKIPVGRIVPVGLALIVVGMFGLTQVTATTPYLLLIGMLVVMGFGMGATMMPLFTTALRTLSGAQVARGSTLLNITQQIASSCGVATMSVILTNQLNNSPIIPGTQSIPGLGDGLRETQAAILSNTRPENLGPLNLDPAAIARGLVDAASAFSHTYWVAWILVALTLVPALMLPRKREKKSPLVDEGVPPAVVD
jgi:predicted MFS family arabinose efflux permease